MRFHALTRTTPPLGYLATKGRHSTAEAKMGLLAAPQAAEGAPEKRKRDLESTATALWLSRMFLEWRKVFHHQKGGSVHISTDGARSGGKESALGVFYDTASQLAVWMPPVDRTGGGSTVAASLQSQHQGFCTTGPAPSKGLRFQSTASLPKSMGPNVPA